MRAVITEAELRRLAPASRVMVPRGAIVTPAARDYARDKGIALIDIAGDGGLAEPFTFGQGTDRTSATGAAVCQQVEISVQDVMERIMRTAFEKLGPHTTREALAKVLTRVLIRLGYAVAVSARDTKSQDR